MNSLFTQIARKARELLDSRTGDPVEQLIADCNELLSSRGEATGLTLATTIFEAWRELNNEQRIQLLTALYQDFGPNRAALERAIHDYAQDPDGAVLAIHEASEPRRQELIRRLNSAPNGTRRLIHLREQMRQLDLPKAMQRALDDDFVHLFSSWFNKGFLQLREINWQTPADLLEKLIAYESVHAIQGWDDLRRRLASDRRCFGYFHPAMPDEPLIFVEVALVKGVATSITPLLNEPEGDPNQADTAVFYSINNCQRGLNRVSFGNFLIKQVVEELRQSLPQLKTFVTLSPIPGLRRWVESNTRAVPEDDEGMRKLCLEYLTTLDQERPLDPVARFHLGNGARLEQINLNADPSDNGRGQSYGAMVNYLYTHSEIVSNHEALMQEGQIALGPKVKPLFKQLTA